MMADTKKHFHRGVSRRQFMTRMGLLGSLAIVYPSAALAELRRSNSKQPLADWQNEIEWQTLMQVQELLFPPAADIPGASDIGAVVYLYRAIENPNADAEDKDFIFRGVGWLDGMTQQQHKKFFLQLNEIQQQKILQGIAKSQAGQNWISLLLSYILEALLMDPVYGGNPDGIGWQWLAHQPGYPTPPVDKTWDKLLQRRYQVKGYKA